MKNTLFEMESTLKFSKEFKTKICPPKCLEPIMNLLYEKELEIRAINFGVDGIELYTDPNQSMYLECCLYTNPELYYDRKHKYQAFIREHFLEGLYSLDRNRIITVLLENMLLVNFCTNDDERMLIWESERDKIDHMKAEDLLAASTGEKDGHIIYDDDSCAPIIESKNIQAGKRAIERKCGRLRFDGIYELKKRSSSEYLRFFPNGKVVGMLYDNTSGDEIFNILDEEYEEFGKYTCDGESIRFCITSSYGVVQTQYHGTINDGHLSLAKKTVSPYKKTQLGLYRFVMVNK